MLSYHVRFSISWRILQIEVFLSLYKQNTYTRPDSETFTSNNSKLRFLLHHYDKAHFTPKTCYITGRQEFFYTTFLSFCLLRLLYTPTVQACDSYVTSTVYLDRHANMGSIYFFLFLSCWNFEAFIF